MMARLRMLWARLFGDRVRCTWCGRVTAYSCRGAIRSATCADCCL